MLKKQPLSITHPEIAKQWHPTKNGNLKSNEFPAEVNKPIWWKCDQGPDHVWRARIADRAKSKARCPFCINYKLSKTNNLLVKHPKLAKLWHYKANFPLTPDGIIGTGQHKKYWWKCIKGHEWKASIGSHIRKDGSYRDCPKCWRVPLANTHPKLTKQWDYKKNLNLSPNIVRAGSPSRVWWKCPKGPDHEWEQRVVERTSGGTGCPFCDGKKLSITNSLQTRYPDLAKQWHFEINKICPNEVYGGGKKKYWWKCDQGPDHEWQASIQKRAVGQGCSVCRGLKVVRSNSMGQRHPSLSKEWHPTKNKNTPFDVIPGNSKKVWWLCIKNSSHEWQASCKSRTERFSGCPYCNSGWTIEKIRLFVSGLLSSIDSFSEVELYVLFQQNGLLSSFGKGRSFVQAFKTGKFPKEELEKFAKKEPSLVDDFINDPEKTLEDDQEADLLNAAHALSEEKIDTDEQLKTIETKQVLETLKNDVYANLDSEAVDFFITSAVSKIWQHAFLDEDKAVAQLKKYNADNVYAQQVTNRFIQEYEASKNLEIPKGYSFAYKPNLMQRYSAYLVKNKKRIGNWSGTGAGKTLSAILASRAINAQLTVICCPNNTIDNWQRRIEETYPKSIVFCKSIDLKKINKQSGIPIYIILNYEFFQQARAGALLNELLEQKSIDFIVIDEIHFSKQRDKKHLTLRKQALEATLTEAYKKNNNLHVLGMSATPVINNLYEGKTLIELITGFYHDEMQTKPTVSNCITLYQKLMLHGIRWLPKYAIKMNLRTEFVECSSYLPEIKQKGLAKVSQLEAILVHSKMQYILSNLKSKTIVYTHYISKILEPLRTKIEQSGWRVGLFTGNEKDGLQEFLNGDADILLASSCAGTGVDGLQRVCNRLIIACLPWTHAEFEQLKGRIYRQGQSRKNVDVLIPLTYATVNGERWSWCESRWKRILFKKSIGDAAVDGVIPEGHLRTKEQALQDMRLWLQRLEQGEMYETERSPLNAELPNENSTPALRKVGDLTRMNQSINKKESSVTHKRFKQNPVEWHEYHAAYRETRKQWEVIPYEEATNWVQKRPNRVVADFGCGEALLAASVSNIVHSFDHIAINDSVIACDMAHVPLENNSIDAAIFSLSLMGTNYADYLREARRCLKLDGQIWIAEPTDRIKDVDGFNELLERLGFDIRPIQKKWKFTFVEAFKSDREICEEALKSLLEKKILD